MENEPTSLTLIQNLEARQDDLLNRLDELNRRVEAALSEFLQTKAAEPAASDAAPELRRAA